MKCWSIHYYFTSGHKKREYKGSVCGCIAGDTKEEAIASCGPFEMSDGNKLVRIVAKPAPKGHFCFSELD